MSGRETNRLHTARVLNRLLNVLYRSFPTYLVSADPWLRDEDRPVMDELRRIVADQQQLAARIADMVIELGARVDLGDFPMAYTSKNFLAIDFLLKELIRYSRRDIAVIEQCIRDLSDAPAARMMAEEALGSEKAHLEALEALAAKRGA